MRVLIRFLSREKTGGVETSDRIIDVPVVTIGRATDRILHVRDRRARLEHARIEASPGGTRIVAETLAGVSVNGRSEREATLGPGDVIEIGANRLTIIEPPEGADLALTFELREDAAEEQFERSWVQGAGGIGGLGKRRLSWALVAAVAVLGFLLPAAGLIDPSVASFLRSASFVPDDGLWLAGPLHSAHSNIADECEACHSRAFRRVPDAACAECHDVARHVSADHEPVLGTTRCASCHSEHNEPPALVNRHQGLCADCHAEPREDSGLPPVGDFLDAHPGFRASLAVADGDGGWTVERLPLAEADGQDRSNLKFDHAAHLDPGGIVAPEGRRTLECADCHEPEPGGAGMQAVSMDEHCAGCHTLAFDPDEPARTVPHGDPEGVVRTLVEFYSARLLGEDPDAVEPRLRRPGRTLTREDRDRAAAEARAQALAVAGDLFERRACATCHEVTRNDEAAIPWTVLEVRLTDRFFPHANFSHAAHATGVTRCDGCHDAGAPTRAADLLIPGIESCRECHGSGIARRNSGGQIASTCVACHGFHDEAKGAAP